MSSPWSLEAFWLSAFIIFWVCVNISFAMTSQTEDPFRFHSCSSPDVPCEYSVEMTWQGGRGNKREGESSAKVSGLELTNEDLRYRGVWGRGGYYPGVEQLVASSRRALRGRREESRLVQSGAQRRAKVVRTTSREFREKRIYTAGSSHGWSFVEATNAPVARWGSSDAR